MKKTFLLSSLALAAGLTFHPGRALAYDLYVDSSSSVSSPDGSEAKPFSKISDAIKQAVSGQSIHIADGKYQENLTLDKSLSLIGQSKTGTVLEGTGQETGLEINAKSEVSNLTVTNFKRGVYVSKNAGATLDSVNIFQNRQTGIEIAQGQTSESKKVTVSDSDIEKNEKGFYILKRKISLSNNRVVSNRQEGIDLRAGVKGTIKKNTISKNKESGIELIIGRSGLKILSNKITGNSASGIANQFYKQSKNLGSIQIAKNKIQKNDDFGIQCDLPSGGKPSANYWTKSIKLSANIFSGNSKISASRCGFQLAKK